MLLRVTTDAALIKRAPVFYRKSFDREPVDRLFQKEAEEEPKREALDARSFDRQDRSTGEVAPPADANGA